MVRVLLLCYMLITALLLSIVFHEATHVIVDHDLKPQRVCVPIMEPNGMEAVAYTEFQPGAEANITTDENNVIVSKKYFLGIGNDEVLPIIISCVPLIFMFFLALREKMLD